MQVVVNDRLADDAELTVQKAPLRFRSQIPLRVVRVQCVADLARGFIGEKIVLGSRRTAESFPADQMHRKVLGEVITDAATQRVYAQHGVSEVDTPEQAELPAMFFGVKTVLDDADFVLVAACPIFLFDGVRVDSFCSFGSCAAGEACAQGLRTRLAQPTRLSRPGDK